MNWFKAIRFRWLNIHPCSQAISIITKEGEKYWIEIDERWPDEIYVLQNGKACGLARMNWLEDQLELWDLFIFEKHRWHGLGTAFLQWLISYARQKKTPRIWAIVSPEKGLDCSRVMDWYIRQGFHRESSQGRTIVLDLNQSE